MRKARDKGRYVATLQLSVCRRCGRLMSQGNKSEATPAAEAPWGCSASTTCHMSCRHPPVWPVASPADKVDSKLSLRRFHALVRLTGGHVNANANNLFTACSLRIACTHESKSHLYGLLASSQHTQLNNPYNHCIAHKNRTHLYGLLPPLLTR
jgi:hypothetical protein